MPAQNLALKKPVIVSSQGEPIASHPPSAANDGVTAWVHFITKDLPWSFVAIDLESLYEINSISLYVQGLARKLKLLVVDALLYCLYKKSNFIGYVCCLHIIGLSTFQVFLALVRFFKLLVIDLWEMFWFKEYGGITIWKKLCIYLTTGFDTTWIAQWHHLPHFVF